MIRRPPRSTPLYSSAASDVYKETDMYPPGSPRNKEGQSEYTFNNAMMDKGTVLLVELTAAQKEKVSEFVKKFEERKKGEEDDKGRRGHLG